MDTYLKLMAGIALGSILLIMLKLFKEHRSMLSAKLFILLLLGASSFVFKQIVQDPPWLSATLETMTSTVPALFWLFTLSFFSIKSDRQTITSIHYLMCFTSIALSAGICLQHAEHRMFEYSELYYLDFTLKVILVSLGLVEIGKNWRNDLVECRRKLRAGIMTMAGILVLFALVNNFVFAGRELPQEIVFINLAATMLMALFHAYWLLIASPDAMLEATDNVVDVPDPVPASTNEADITHADKIWLEKLQHCMQGDAYYRDTELTIRRLSEHLEIPEHQLRRLINQHLGYRNFNDYLNRFRISEASDRLADPTQSRLPITTIAIESGYASLTTFNKAFKALQDKTPSEFRRSAMES